MSTHTASELRGYPSHLQPTDDLIWGMPHDMEPVSESGGQEQWQSDLLG